MWAALCAAGILTSQFCSPVQAMMLSGHASVGVPATSVAPASYPMPVTVQSPARMAVPHPAYQLSATAGSEPSQYEGTWRCVSHVTSSSVAKIAPGREMDCLLQFKLNSQGQLVVYWDEAGWNPTNCAVVSFSPVKSSIVHKSISLSNSNWAALSSDRLRMLSISQMEGRSKVIQYQCGQPVGVYETASYLTRVQ